MGEVCEIVQKQLKGNTVAKNGINRFKLVTNETATKPSWEHLKTKADYGNAIVHIWYANEQEVGSTYSIPVSGSHYFLEPTSSASYVGLSKRIVEELLIVQDFSTKLWKNVSSLLNENREEAALLYLYEELNAELNNVPNCDSFLKYSLSIKLNSDLIIHILNALYPIRSVLNHWEEFKQYSLKLMTAEVGEEPAKILFKAIG